MRQFNVEGQVIMQPKHPILFHIVDEFLNAKTATNINTKSGGIFIDVIGNCEDI